MLDNCTHAFTDIPRMVHSNKTSVRCFSTGQCLQSLLAGHRQKRLRQGQDEFRLQTRKGVAGYYVVGSNGNVVQPNDDKLRIKSLDGEQLEPQSMLGSAYWGWDMLEDPKHYYHSQRQPMSQGVRDSHGNSKRRSRASRLNRTRSSPESAQQYWEKQHTVVMDKAQMQGVGDQRAEHGLQCFSLKNIEGFVQSDHQMQRVLALDGKLAAKTFPDCTRKSSACQLVACLLDRVAAVMYGREVLQGGEKHRQLFCRIPKRSGGASSSAETHEMCWPWDWQAAKDKSSHSISTTCTDPGAAYLRIYLGRAPPEAPAQSPAQRSSCRMPQPRSQHADAQQPWQQQLEEVEEEGREQQAGLQPVHITVHRLVCALCKGAAPTRQHEASHLCHHPWCLQGGHIEWMTHKENMNTPH